LRNSIDIDCANATISSMKNEWTNLRVKKPTLKRIKVSAAKADKKMDEYLNFLLDKKEVAKGSFKK